MERGFRISILLVVVMLGLSVGCAKQETRVDRFYGTSYELARYSQIHNLEAGVKDGPSVGLGGEVGAAVIDRYEKGFEQPAAKTETYSISVDGIQTK